MNSQFTTNLRLILRFVRYLSQNQQIHQILGEVAMTQ